MIKSRSLICSRVKADVPVDWRGKYSIYFFTSAKKRSTKIDLRSKGNTPRACGEKVLLC